MYDDENRGFGPTTPVEVGDEIDVTIEAVGEKGDGIAKKKGFVLFIPNTKQGERVRIRVTKVLRKVGFAEKIGDAGAPAENQEEAPAAKEAPAEPSPEDSEDFGEEEPAEEPAEDLGMPEEASSDEATQEEEEKSSEDSAPEEPADEESKSEDEAPKEEPATEEPEEPADEEKKEE